MKNFEVNVVVDGEEKTVEFIPGDELKARVFEKAFEKPAELQGFFLMKAASIDGAYDLLVDNATGKDFGKAFQAWNNYTEAEGK